jgi:2'-5' RNA ligase
MARMRLFAAVMPPVAVLEELADVVRSVAPDTPELDAVPVDALHIPITAFGNVTTADARQLQAALAREAATWPAPELRFAGGAALEWPTDRSVWARLDGDVEELETIGRGVPVVVQRLGFFVDRRRFRPWVSVGTITDKTTAPYLEKLVDALEIFRGTPFRLEEVSLLRGLPVTEDGEDGGFEVLERLSLKTD